MLGISFFKPSPNIEPVTFEYEIRKLGYVQFGDIWYFAGGDKAGTLKLCRYDGTRVKLIDSASFAYKIIDIEFIIYGKNLEKMGVMVALEKEGEPNIYFHPNVTNGSFSNENWCEVRHGRDIPQLIFYPYVKKTEEVVCMVFSFQEGDFVLGEVKPNPQKKRSYLIKKKWTKKFTSRIMDACVEYPANIERTRAMNMRERSAMYIASRAGDIWVFEMDPHSNTSPKKEPDKIKTISNSITSIIPIQRIGRKECNIKGILGIAGQDFFILYSKPGGNPGKNQYKYQKESFRHTLHSITTGTFKNPDKKKKPVYNTVIFLGDSQNVLHARQVEKDLDFEYISDTLFESRKVFSESLNDRALDLIPIDYISPESGSRALFRLALGMGDHRIIFKDLLNKNHIIDDIKGELAETYDEDKLTQPEVLNVKQYKKLARESECGFRKKCKLIAAIFYHKPGEQPLALNFLQEVHINHFIRLMYWLLSGGERAIYNQVYKQICKLIQEFKKEDRSRSKNKTIYSILNRLLEDIEKFWIGGNTYSRKEGDMLELIELNHNNGKFLDKAIYQAIVNDRGYSLDFQREVSGCEIQTICQLNEMTLLTADNGGYLHFLNFNDFSSSKLKLDIKKYNGIIYQGKEPKYSDSDKNFVRKIAILPGGKWGALLLRAGGIWIFNFDKLFKVKAIDGTKSKSEMIEKIMFPQTQGSSPSAFLIADGILPYSIKEDRGGECVYVGDRFGGIFKLVYTNEVPSGLTEIYRGSESKVYNPIWDFDFFEDGRIVFGDRLGNVTFVSPDGEPPDTINFPKAPFFNSCHVCNGKTIVLGTEEGEILALDYSGNEGPSCMWTYKLPGAIRFTEKTHDNNLLIGGMCGKAVLISLTGKVEDLFDFERYTVQARKHPVLINCLLPLKSSAPDVPQHQRLYCITGDDRGVLRVYRLFNSRIYEQDLHDFFNKDNSALNLNKSDKIKMRCIDIRENSLRRHYTAYIANRDKWEFEETCEEVVRIAHRRDYHYLLGPQLFLVPRLTDKFIRLFEDHIQVRKFQTHYYEFQNAVILLATSWGVENDASCQQLMKALGVGIIRVMTNREMYLKSKDVVKLSPNMRGLFELLETVHVHSNASTLIDMYEEIKDFLAERKDSPYFEAIIEFICLRFRGREFDKLIPDPLLLKKLELLAFITDNFDYCPIKLSYKLIEYYADMNIFHFLSYKVIRNDNRRVFEVVYTLDNKIKLYPEVPMELEVINSFPEKFPEKFEEDAEGFYSEFEFVFKSIQSIQQFSDAMIIASSDRLHQYLKEAKWYQTSIRLLNNLIEKISRMKVIFEQLLDPSRDIPIPRFDLISLRNDLKKMSESVEDVELGTLYKILILDSVYHIEDILTNFCEITLPIQTIERTASYLENYLEEIHKREKPLPTFERPDSLTLFNGFYKRMFDAIIAGLNPQYACFQHEEVIFGTDILVEDFFDCNAANTELLTQDEMLKRMEYGNSQSKTSEEFPLNLTDSDHFYGLIWVGFTSKNGTIDSSSRATKYRFKELVEVLNLYIIAFTGIIEAEVQNRLNHRIFAHQTKEPLLTIKQQLELLTSPKFNEPIGPVIKDYHERMLRIISRMLRRIENILNANKDVYKIDLNLSQFDLYATVHEVVRNMRKVMESKNYPGEINYPQPNETLFVNSDETKLREILEQLVFNSLKYCRGTRLVNVTTGHDSNYFYLKIRDNGQGIPEHEMPFIFNMFFRGQIPSESDTDGDGLGLWVVDTFVKRLGGEIRAANIKGDNDELEGVRFEIKLPLTPPRITEETNE